MIGWHYVTQFYWRILVMGEYYIRKRKEIRLNIIQAAKKYKEKLLGKKFAYIYDSRFLEVSYTKKTFLHLTGVNTRLSATTFFQEAINGTLQENQIFFNQRYPLAISEKKSRGLKNLDYLTSKDVFILEGINTQTLYYDKGLNDIDMTLLLRKLSQKSEASLYAPQSLRIKDKSFERCQRIYSADFILEKEYGDKLYNRLIFGDLNKINMLPQKVLNQIDIDKVRGESVLDQVAATLETPTVLENQDVRLEQQSVLEQETEDGIEP